MKSLSFLTYERSLNEQRLRVLSIFVAGTPWNEAEFDEEVVSHIKSGGAPVDAIELVGHSSELELVGKCLQDPDDTVSQRLSSITGPRAIPTRLITFDPVAGAHVLTDLSGGHLSDADILAANRQGSLREAFALSGGLQQAPIGTHYVKTSRSHSDRFLRVSNVLESSENVELVAFWLLPFLWKSDAQNVVVDTSGLYGAVRGALLMAYRLGGLVRAPRVWSHWSHEGVDRIPTHLARNSRFVISASTSGGLAERLIARGARQENITTVYSASKGPVRGQVMCDLLKDPGSIPAIENHSELDCPFCRKRYHSIQLQGDQFSVEPPAVTEVMVTARDLPSPLKDQLSAIAGLEVFRAYLSTGGEEIRALGVNVTPLIEGELNGKSKSVLSEKRAEWAAMKRRACTLALTKVVSCNYPGSLALAQSLLTEAGPLMPTDRQPQIVGSKRLAGLEPAPCTAAIVAAAAVDSPREFLSISRSLRDVQPDGPISYLSVADLSGSKPDSDLLRANITFGRHGNQTFNWFNLFSFPVDCHGERPSWADELDLLRRVVDWADEGGFEIPENIESRIDRLSRAPAEGLVHDLFWPDPTGAALRLRSDFTLLHGSLSTPAATQADLFAVVMMVLARLRRDPDISRRLAHNAYQRSVLSPQVFARFNDGVLQACFLRASRSKELAFGAATESLSEQMLDILLESVPGSGTPERSEAFTEFIIALMTQRLSLRERHLSAFLDSVQRRAGDLPAEGRMLAGYLAATAGFKSALARG